MVTRHGVSALASGLTIAMLGLATAIGDAGHYFARSDDLVSIAAIGFAAADLKKRLAAAPAFCRAARADAEGAARRI